MKKLEPVPVDKINIGCLTCSTVQQRARMDMIICVGFGLAYITKNNKVFYDSHGREWYECKALSAIERIARKHSKADWRLVMYGPLHGETYQRQGRNKWVIVESNQGFA